MSNGKFGDNAGARIELSSDAIFPLGDRRRYPFLDPPLAPEEIGRAGDYRILREIGAGGMGIVFAAEDTILHRSVALKVLRPDLASDPENRERFLREARATAALASDNIVTVFQVGVVNGVPYLAEQFLPGESLQDRLDRATHVDLRSSLVIARGAAAGLAAAHAAGLIHRDIKPANIWLESDSSGEFLRARLLDFGLARRMTGEASLTGTGVIVGTPNFMSPEHANDREIDHRADLFSLGAVLYTMIAGELPFPGKSAMAAMVAVTTRAVPRLSEKYPGMPRGVSALIAQLLAKEPNDRPQTAREAMAILDAEIARLPEIAIALLPSPLSVPLEVAETVGPSASITKMDAKPVPARRRNWRWAERIAGSSLTLALILLVVYLAFVRGPSSTPDSSGEPIKVGVLYSTTGAMAASEVPLLDSAILAIEELNRAGGINGRKLIPIIANGNSDSAEFARQAKKLLIEDKVSVIFGCWLSSALKSVRSEVERHDGLLFFPIHYEGLEESPRVVYLGLTPNQQLLPALDFITGKLGRKRLFLLGGSDIYSHATHAMVRDWIEPRPGVSVVGEVFLRFGIQDVDDTVAKVVAAKPDALLNTIDGSTNFVLFRKLREAGITPDRMPILSVSITESELRGIGFEVLAGSYLTASYFQSVNRPEGRDFQDKIQAKYSKDKAVSDLMASAYISVKLWAQAVSAAGSAEPGRVAAAVKGMEIEGVAGRLRIDPETMHTWRPWRIGRVQPNGTVEVVADSGTSVRPIPFPTTRSRQEWNRFLDNLFAKWNGSWEDPTKP